MKKDFQFSINCMNSNVNQMEIYVIQDKNEIIIMLE